MESGSSQDWESIRAQLMGKYPDFYELEPGGAIVMELGRSDWLLELQPVGRLLCQIGVDMDDLRDLLTGNTTEDLSGDELQRVARDHLRPSVHRFRNTLLNAGFEEGSEMGEEYVAWTFQRELDFNKPDAVTQTIDWCRRVFQ